MRSRSRNLSRMRRAPQCSIPHVEVDPATVEATPEEVRDNYEAIGRDADFWEELRGEYLAEKWRRFQEDLRWYRENIGGGINLELSLLIMLLVLVCVLAVSPLGAGIANQYAAAAGVLTGAGSYTSPDNGGSSDNGDGSHTVRWDNGEPPFQIRRSVLPDMSGAEIVGSTPDRSYSVIPQPGANYFEIIDNRGGTVLLPAITVPYPPATDCTTYQKQIATAEFQWAQAEVLTSGARPLVAPATLDEFYAEVLPYAATTRHVCGSYGEYDYFNDATGSGPFVLIRCPDHTAHPVPPQSIRMACYVNQMAIEAAARNYHEDTGLYPAPFGSFAAELVPGYLTTSLFCPEDGSFYTLDASGIVQPCPTHGHF